MKKIMRIVLLIAMVNFLFYNSFIGNSGAVETTCITNANCEVEIPKRLFVDLDNILYEDVQAIMSSKKMNELSKIKSDTNKEEFLAYKEIQFKYAQWCDIPETVFDAYEPEEVRLICRMVETECYQQDFDSKCNVASVAFNRLESGRFGENMTEVITNPGQFAYGRKKITEDSILAVMYAFEFGDTAQGALYFHSGKWTATFNRADYIFTDQCGHHFFK